MSRFLDAPVPMAAKCIIRDHIWRTAGCSIDCAEVTAGNIVCEMLELGFEIKDVYPRNDAMAQQDDQVNP